MDFNAAYKLAKFYLLKPIFYDKHFMIYVRHQFKLNRHKQGSGTTFISSNYK